MSESGKGFADTTPKEISPDVIYVDEKGKPTSYGHKTPVLKQHPDRETPPLLKDIPLYELVQKIEKKHGHNLNMVIDAFLKNQSEENEHIRDSDILEDGMVRADEIYWYCEFQDQKKIFDHIAAVESWFLKEVVYNPEIPYTAPEEVTEDET